VSARFRFGKSLKLVFLLAAFGLSESVSAGDIPVRVATFNIENLNTTSGPQFDAAVDSLQRICADVVCVQEIGSFAVLLALENAAGFSDSVLADTSNAIDANLQAGVLSVYPIVSASTENSISLSGDGSARDLTRNFIVAAIDVPGAAEDVVVISNHWKAGTSDGDEFRRSLESIRAVQASDHFSTHSVPYVIAGDMNDDIGDGGDSPFQFVSLPGGLPGSFSLGNDIAFPVINSVFFPLQDAACNNELSIINALQLDGSDGTRPASGRRLDYLWVSNAATPVASEVYDSVDEGIGGGIAKCGTALPAGTSAQASDHLPVIVDLLVPATAITGACCMDGFCVADQLSAACTCAGGIYQGDGVDCENVDCGSAPTIRLNEIRTDQPGGDPDEFFELVGPPGTSLDGFTYIVIGDGSGASGVVETVIDLTGQSINGSGYFVAAGAGFSLGVPDWETSLSFEDGDNVTHMLVFNFTGMLGDDLDTNEDGVLDITPWAEVVDRVAIILEDNPPVTTEWHYGPPTVGPDGMSAPGHVFRCAEGLNGWQIGPFDPNVGVDTPGVGNACPGACCLPGDCQDVMSSAACDMLGGFYLGFGTDCLTDSCPPFGACCAQGLCTDDTANTACTDGGGTFQGDGTTCGATDCPSGACCTGGMCADDVAQATCEAGAGSYQGDGSTCEAVTCASGPQIHEIRIDSASLSDDEYFELTGDPGMSLDDLTYLVIGDGAGGSGIIDTFVDLDGQSLNGSGLLLVAEDDVGGVTPDFTAGLNFEDGDNVTHLLVAGFTGFLAQDLDTDDDGVLEETPWAVEFDRIAVIEEENPPTGTEFHYGPPTVGPDNGAAPAHVIRCGAGNNGWIVGSVDFDPGVDSPGAANVCPTGACCGAGDACTPELTLGECQGMGGEWFDGANCEDVTCASIPAASTWGMITFFLMTLSVGTVAFRGKPWPVE